MITRRAAADRAKVSLRTLARLLANGTLTKHKDALGRVWVDEAEVDALATPQPVAKKTA
jgi:hypothetical protein